MNKRIQTPLISKEFYKDIPLKVFAVVSDSLAPLMWRGMDLHCLPIPYHKLPEIGTFIVVECRIIGRKHCSYQVGIVEGVMNQVLTLGYDHKALKEPISDWSIPLSQVKRLWKVDKFVKCYAHMRKFYPHCPY